LKNKLLKEQEFYCGTMVEGREEFTVIYEKFKQHSGKNLIEDFEWFLEGFEDFVNYRIGYGCFSNYITAICLSIEESEKMSKTHGGGSPKMQYRLIISTLFGQSYFSGKVHKHEGERVASVVEKEKAKVFKAKGAAEKKAKDLCEKVGCWVQIEEEVVAN